MERKKLTHSEDPVYGASSSSISPYRGDYEAGTKRPKENDYGVFLSFGEKDTRKSFTDQLYTNLVNKGVRVFKNNKKLRVGEELLYSITQSMISIPIISEGYASSKWCLRELTQMLKCKGSRWHIVLPIFYKVEPSQMQYLVGRLKDAINAREENIDQFA